LFRDAPHRVPGTAIFLTATPEATPHALLHNLNHNKVLHERVVFLTVETHDVPWVPFEDRVSLEPLGHGCWRVTVRYGFMDQYDVMRALELCAAMGLAFDLMQTSFFISRQKVVPTSSTMARWRERLFAPWRATPATSPTTSTSPTTGSSSWGPGFRSSHRHQSIAGSVSVRRCFGRASRLRASPSAPSCRRAGSGCARRVGPQTSVSSCRWARPCPDAWRGKPPA
jgi:hypothetical protein